MGLKPAGVRGSLRQLSVGIPAPPNSGGTNQWDHTEGSGTALTDSIGTLDGSISGAAWTAGAGTNNTFLLYDGSNDFTDLGSASQSALSHIIRNGEGTFVVWIRNDDNATTRNHVFGNDRGTGFRFWMEADNSTPSYFVGYNTNGTNIQVMGDDPTADVGDWVALIMRADGSNLYGEIARPPGYTISEIGSTSITATTANDLGQTVQFGDSPSALAPFDGGIDLSYANDTGQSQATVQDFIDQSKIFYQ